MTDLFELQSVPLSSDPRIRALYYHYRGGGHQLPLMRDNRKAIILSRGCEFDLNTYFGSFYECYWRRYTDIKQVYFTFKLNGRARFRLYRYSPEIKLELLYEADLTGSAGAYVIPVPEPTTFPTTHGRVFVQFLSREDNTIIDDIVWRTSLPPRREARLEATMCTFNREKELAETLTNLYVLQRENLVHRITVVNHAARGFRQRLEKLLPDHLKDMPFKLIEQANTGSAGGMARGILEALESGDCNYLLRLDDDIRIDPAVFRRLPILLGYLHDHIAVGSHMLDGLTHTGLHEAGSVLHPEALGFQGVAHNADIRSEKGLNLFSKVDFIDYNAWWCYAVSTGELSKDNLPMPFFLYIDDIEFAIRLKDKVQNVSWACLAVWHDPFYAKRAPYKSYYYLCNILSAYAYHGILDKKGALRELWRFFSAAILQLYYNRAWACVRAMEDFLKGPKYLANWTAASHRELIADEKRWSEPDLPRSVLVPPARLTGKPPRWKVLRPFCIIARIIGDTLRPAKPKAPLGFADYWTAWNIWTAKGQERIAVNHDREDVYHVYVRDPRKLRRLLVRFARAYVVLAFYPSGIRDKAEMDRLTTEAFWRIQFRRD